MRDTKRAGSPMRQISGEELKNIVERETGREYRCRPFSIEVSGRKQALRVMRILKSLRITFLYNAGYDPGKITYITGDPSLEKTLLERAGIFRIPA